MPQFAARFIDKALEVSVVGSFTAIGAAARSRLFAWQPLTPIPGKTVVITGASSGLGRQLAVELAGMGAKLVLVARNQQRLAEVAAAARAVQPHPQPIVTYQCDLSSLAQTRDLAQRINCEQHQVDVLIHNAGAVTQNYTVTAEGFEVTYASQVLAVQLLTEELLDALRAAPAPRVIVVTSGGMYTENLQPQQMQLSEKNYDALSAYAKAKRAQVALVSTWASSEKLAGIWCGVMHPGWADTPGVADSLPGFYRLTQRVLRSPTQGADTAAWLATFPGDLPSGKLWLDRVQRSTQRLPGKNQDQQRAQELSRHIESQLQSWRKATAELS